MGRISELRNLGFVDVEGVEHKPEGHYQQIYSAVENLTPAMGDLLNATRKPMRQCDRVDIIFLKVMEMVWEQLKPLNLREKVILSQLLADANIALAKRTKALVGPATLSKLPQETVVA